MYSNLKLQIRDGPLFFVSLSLQSDFSNCIILACVAGGFSVCFLFCGSQSKITAARKLNRVRNRKRWVRGRGKKGHCLRAQHIVPMNHLTQNVNTGDKSVWYIFLYTENIFYVYFTKQTNWIMIYTWLNYLQVCKLFIFFFSCLRTIHFSFFAFANNFFPDVSSPLPKSSVRSLKTIYIAKWRHSR